MNLRSGRFVHAIHFKAPVLALGVGRRGVWVALAPTSLGGNAILTHIAASGRSVAVGAVGSNPISIAPTNANIWVANGDGPPGTRLVDTVTRFSRVRGTWRRTSLQHVSHVEAVAANDGRAWIARQDGAMTTIITAGAKRSVLAHIAGTERLRMLYTGGSLWAARTSRAGRALLTRIDVESGVSETTSYPSGVVEGLASAGSNGVWLTISRANSTGVLFLRRGSTTRQIVLAGVTGPVAGTKAGAWVVTGQDVRSIDLSGRTLRTAHLGSGVDALGMLSASELLATNHLSPVGYVVSLR
jgi:hypothetical protein